MTQTFFVAGTPRPQGSAKAFVVGGKARITSATKDLNPWRADIHAAARGVVGDSIAVPTGPVSLDLEFIMPRRAAEPKRSTPPHIRKPDMDKLIRAALDALTGVLYTDDGQVNHFTSVVKRTAEIGEQPGLRVSWS